MEEEPRVNGEDYLIESFTKEELADKIIEFIDELWCGLEEESEDSFNELIKDTFGKDINFLLG